VRAGRAGGQKNGQEPAPDHVSPSGATQIVRTTLGG
jgi:hypothetical protein